MRTSESHKLQEINQKQRSVSTSSFYRQTIYPKNMKKNNQLLSHAIQIQQRQTQQSFQKLKLTIDMKLQYLNKRKVQSDEQNQKTLDELQQTEKGIEETYKSTLKIDKTKQWAAQMQKTIQSIMQNNKEYNKKILQKNMSQCKKMYENCDNLQDKWREQRKQRQRQWQQLISSVGETIMNAQTLIQNQREQMQFKLVEVQRKILDIQQDAGAKISRQSMSRKQQHQYLTKLIQRIMDKLIH